MGRLELPLPELGKSSLKSSAEELQKRVRAQVPKKFRASVMVRPFKKSGRTGLAIEYDDKAESFVYTAIEYPK